MQHNTSIKKKADHQIVQSQKTGKTSRKEPKNRRTTTSIESTW